MFRIRISREIPVFTGMTGVAGMTGVTGMMRTMGIEELFQRDFIARPSNKSGQLSQAIHRQKTPTQNTNKNTHKKHQHNTPTRKTHKKHPHRHSREGGNLCCVLGLVVRFPSSRE